MITKDDIKTMEQINSHAYRFTISADAWKEDSKRKWVEASKVANELEEILIITSARECSHKEMYNYLVMQIKHLQKQLRGESQEGKK